MKRHPKRCRDLPKTDQAPKKVQVLVLLSWSTLSFAF